MLACSLLYSSGAGFTAPGAEFRGNSEQGGTTEASKTITDVDSRKELLGLMDKLEQKLAPSLRRKLIIISMKLMTGWCSPYLALEFEEEIKQLPERERQLFEAEWKAVRRHEAWPRMPVPTERPRSALPISRRREYSAIGE